MQKIIFTVAIFLFLFPTTIFAQNNIEIVDLPHSVAIGEKFELSVEIAMSASSTYYIKARAGNTLSSMRNVLTHNSSKKTWLSDTSAWSKFSTFSTDENGLWAGIVNVKIKESTPLGGSLILIRIRKLGTTKNLDSEAKTIEIVTSNQTTTPGIKSTNPSNLKVILNEFSPAPEGNREWVEIYNPNSLTVDLTGWKIDDIPKGSSPFKIPDSTKISSRGYKVFYFSSKLNNSGDTIRLINPSGEVIEKFSYGKVSKGVTFAKDSKGAWKTTTTPTPGKENKITGQPVSSLELPNDLSKSLFELTSGSQEAIQNLPGILGVEDPSSFSDTSDTRPIKTEFAKTKETNSQSSIPTILVGLGIILIGIAFGIPVLKQQGTKINEADNN